LYIATQADTLIACITNIRSGDHLAKVVMAHVLTAVLELEEVRAIQADVPLPAQNYIKTLVRYFTLADDIISCLLHVGTIHLLRVEVIQTASSPADIGFFSPSDDGHEPADLDGYLIEQFGKTVASTLVSNKVHGARDGWPSAREKKSQIFHAELFNSQSSTR
jgi:hypothetical protein